MIRYLGYRGQVFRVYGGQDLYFSLCGLGIIL
jgi:hypothetical protein